MRMSDADQFPVLMCLYTRELRDKLYNWVQKIYPDKRVLKLDSPMEELARQFDFNETGFYDYLKEQLLPGEHFSKALRGYLEASTMIPDDFEENDAITEGNKKIVSTYNKLNRAFKRKLKYFFDGHYDLVLMTQQGLMYRILYSNGFSIPSNINVVFDELEVGLWAEGETNPSYNIKADQMLGAGGRWTILTGDSRPTIHMPSQFRVINLIKKQFITPIIFRTGMPFGVGRSIRKINFRSHLRQRRHQALAEKRNHRNREIALPLLIAEEKAIAKEEGKVLQVVGNVGQEHYKDLGIRTFESLKGDNTFWKSRKSFRIVVIGTCPHQEVLK